MRAIPVGHRGTPCTHEPTIGLPDALLDPAAYRQRPASVELRETHISWVFLTNETAYKVKKPVYLPFVDYNTLERRRTCSHAELRAQPPFLAGHLPRASSRSCRAGTTAWPWRPSATRARSSTRS